MVALLRILLYLAEFVVVVWAGWSTLSTAHKAQISNWVINWTLAGLTGATSLLGQGEALLQPIVTAFLNAFNTYGGPLAAELRAPIAGFVKEEFDVATAGLVANGESTPDNAVGIASDAMADAFGFGAASAAVTAAFEALFPEKLNTLNGVGPMLAKFAGFDEVAAAVRDPLYENAFGRSLDYHFRSVFKPELPNEGDAVEWHSRGLLTDDQLRTIFNYSGLKTEYETPFINSAYRAVSAFIGLRLLESGQLTDADAKDLLQFNGYRPVDIQRLIDYGKWAALTPFRAAYLTAAERSTELGVMTPVELDQELTALKYSQAEKDLIQLTIATRKTEQLAQLYRKSISEAYKTGQITDAQYVPSLEAIGIGAADAQAHYAVDSIAKTGKALAQALRAEERLASQRMRAGVAAAVASYKSGLFDAAALEAALLAAGMDPVVAGLSVEVQTQRRDGNVVLVYGAELPRAAALELREKVAALAIQVRAQLVAPADALTALAGYGVPRANALALVAEWAATTVTPARVGVLEPR